MKQIAKHLLIVIAMLCLLSFVWRSGAPIHKPAAVFVDTISDDSTNIPGDTITGTDTLINLPYPFDDDIGGQPPDSTGNSLFLNNPSNIEKNIEYDTETGQYNVSEKIGDNNFRNPTYMTLDEYLDYDMEKAQNDYWRQRASSENFDKQRAIIPKIHIGGEVLDRIFGGSTVDIRPQGSAELTFALKTVKTDNPALPEKTRKTTTFDFDEKIQMSVTGSIGDKMKITTNYNTEASFDFENKMKLEYSGKEDEIIKKIEAGDVSLPLSGSLITGSQTLFGIKTQLQFGKLFVTSVLSQEKGKKSEIEVCGGAQTNTFDIKADQYEENKHFFLAQYFRDNYERGLENLPFVNSLINITKIEVWVTGRPGEINSTRNILAFMDLGEANYFDTTGFISTGTGSTPSNDANSLYATIIDSGSYLALRDINKVNSAFSTTTLVAAQDYEKVESARLLSASEYSYNPLLGFISINSSLNSDEVLAVAFQYQFNGKTYQVGEFSSGGISAPNTLFVKLLKSTEIKTNLPTWDLMMKNVYSIGSYNIQKGGFKLDVLYKDPQVGTPANYLKEGAVKSTPLIEILNLDNLNLQNDPQPDGLFDFIEGVTINSSNGRVYFPVLEPFGDYLRGKITGGDLNLQTLANRYVYDELYELTKSLAQEHPDRNRFSLYGSYQSSSNSSDIPLGGINIPEGSVTVSAGGRQLTEGVDYTVNYKIGRVSIINEGVLNSGTCIKISYESNQLFAIQQKSLLGSRLDYRASKDLNLGGTIMRLSERPITRKINIGDEPIANTIWGLDANYKAESRLITKMVDILPLINTKETSSFTINSEFAHLIPGHSRAVGKEGISYIDDFEGSKSTIDLKSFSRWVHASTPQGQAGLFPEAEPNTGLSYGYNRAKLAWYVIDPLFARNNSLTPDHIKDDDVIQSNHYVREVLETEIFPNREQKTGELLNMAVFDIAFYPAERGPHNYDIAGEPGLSAGTNTDGTLSKPETRWGGIMRDITTNDFEAANIEFIEFWMMNPFHDDNGTPGNKGGDLYFNLGSVSEDILRDGRKSFENGLPTSAVITSVDTTIWGRVPVTQAIVDAFDNNPDARAFQDVGLDGLSDADENLFFKNYLDSIGLLLGTTSSANSEVVEDPSSDNYHYFRGGDYDDEKKSILDRYKLYNGMDRNSPPTENSTESYPTSSTTLPNKEDINRDNTLSENESYYQYRVSLRPGDLVVGQNHITDAVTGQGTTKDGNAIDVKWYQFKIPVKNPEQVIGSIQDFKSIRFIRMFMKGFEEKAVCRFARLELVRSEWRKYNSSLLYPGEYIPDDNFDATTYDVSVVNIEENGKRTPIPYILPPDIEREQDPADINLRNLNEQSLTMKVCGLEDGDARAAYKITNFDVRSYKRLKMYVHAEDVTNEELLKYGDLTVFIRLGSDFTDNYYEYEIPLTFTPHGSYDPDIYEDRQKVWPEANNFNFEFKVLQDAKQERNKQEEDITKRFPYPDGKNTVYVKGTPDLSRVNTIMIGIRNPKNTVSGGDALPKCGEIWLNELRVTDFDESSGWAANTRVTTKLADLGTVTLAGNISTPGFGSVDKKVSERSRETAMQYDVSSTLQLGKFIPEKVGIKIPMYVGYSEAIIKPQYNPLDPDILMKDALNEYNPANPEEVAERDSLKRITRDYTRRKSINFTNVQKTRGKGSKKPHFYDIENLALTYAYTDVHSENITTEFNNAKTYRGAVSYNFSNRPKNFQPFAKAKPFFKAKYLKPIKDFNFYLMPSQLSFRTDMNRMFSETKPRNTSGFDLLIDTTFAKTFGWNRFYDLKYDITKSVKFDFSAVNNAIIDEPDGRIDTEEKKDSVWENINNLGRTTGYHHTFNSSYTLPFNKIPLTDWITATVSYGGNYDWIAAPLGFDSLGNTIMNSNSKQLNGQFNLVTEYNKVKYLKKINDKYSKSGRKKFEPEYKIVKYEKDKVNFKAREPKNIYHKLNTKDIVEFKVYDSQGKEVKSKIFIVSENKITLETQQNVQNAKVTIDAKKKKGLDLEKIIELTARTAMSVKNVSFNYTESHGTTLPGYMKNTEFIGQDWDEQAPGLDFLFGYQPGQSFLFGNKPPAQIKRDREEWLNDKANRGWISSSTYLNGKYLQSETKTLNIKATVEPLPDLKIDLTANRSESNAFSEFFRDTTGFGDYEHLTPYESGNFSISFISLGTAFKRDDTNRVSEIFTRFANNRESVSAELAEEYQSRNSKYDPQSGGFGNTSQDVLIPAFLEAYAGVKPKSVLFNPFLKIPKPNWLFRYDGLSEIPLIKKYFSKVTLGHGYRSSFNISTYTTNVYYIDESGGTGKEYTTERDANGNYIAKYEINQVSISEQFSPLIKIDMNWKFRPLITNFEIKKTRNLSMDFTNNQLSEVRSNEVLIGAGYRFKDVEIPIKAGKVKKNLKSDLVIDAKFSVRDNKTIIRKLVEQTNTPLSGQRVITIKATADYVINQRFNIRFFYDKILNKPFVSSSFPNSTSSIGFTIRFTLAA